MADFQIKVIRNTGVFSESIFGPPGTILNVKNGTLYARNTQFEKFCNFYDVYRYFTIYTWTNRRIQTTFEEINK